MWLIVPDTDAVLVKEVPNEGLREVLEEMLRKGDLDFEIE